MSRYIANVDITTETFGSWLSRTNSLLDALATEIITANTTFANTGNTASPRIAQLFGSFGANTLIATDALRGGNVTSSANLNLTSNVVLTGVYFSSTANSLYSNTQLFNANVVANGALLSITGSNTSITSNLNVTALSQILKANSTVTTYSMVANSTAANTTVGGTDFNISANIAITGVNHVFGGNVNFDANTLFVDSVNNRVGIGTNAPDTALTVVGSANVGSNFRAGGTLTAIGAGSITNTFAAGNTTITGFTNISATANVGGALNVVGAGSITNAFAAGNTTITGFANISSTANVGGALTVTGGTTISNVVAAGNTTVTGFINVSTTANVGGALNVVGAGSVGGALTVTGNISSGGNTTLTGTAHTIAGNVNFDTGTLFIDSVNNRIGIGNTTPAVALQVTGSANIAGTLAISGAIAIQNTAAFGNTTITGFANISSTANVGGALNVVGTTTLQSNIAVTGSISTTNQNLVGPANEFMTEVLANTNIGNNSVSRLIYSFPKASYRTGKLMVQATNTGNNQIAEMVVAHDNTTAYITVYGVVASPAVANNEAPLGTFAAVINNANVEISMTQTYSNSAVTVVAQLIK